MKDKATVEQVAKAAFIEWWKANYHINADGFADYKRCWEAALTALPSESGLVEALEGVNVIANGIIQRDVQKSSSIDYALHNDLQRIVTASAKALATHREGNPWSDTPPTDCRKCQFMQRIKPMKERIAALEAALEFYATEKSYKAVSSHYMCHGEPHTDYSYPIITDKGAVARKSLTPPKGGAT